MAFRLAQHAELRSCTRAQRRASSGAVQAALVEVLTLKQKMEGDLAEMGAVPPGVRLLLVAGHYYDVLSMHK